ncbi:MAG: FG-GAP repeat domain-containing protein [Candidatus Helarchaeota archaeon]
MKTMKKKQKMPIFVISCLMLLTVILYPLGRINYISDITTDQIFNNDNEIELQGLSIDLNPIQLYIIDREVMKTKIVDRNIVNPDLFLLEKNSTSIFEVLTYLNGYDISSIFNITINATDFGIGDPNNDLKTDIAYLDNFVNGKLDFHFYNISTNGYSYSVTSAIISGSTDPVDAFTITEFLHTGQIDVICSYTNGIYSYYWNQSANRFIEEDSILVGFPFFYTPSIMKATDINGDFQNEIIMFGTGDLSKTYFVILEKNETAPKFKTTFKYINTTSVIVDFIFMDIDNNNKTDILALTSTNLYVYTQDSSGNFSSEVPAPFSSRNCKKIDWGYLDKNFIPDIIITNGTHMLIYYNSNFDKKPEIFTLNPLVINDFTIGNFKDDDYQELLLTVFNGTHSELLLFIQKEASEESITETLEIVVESVSSGALAGITAISSIIPGFTGGESTQFSAPISSEGAAGEGDVIKYGAKSDSKINLGIKKPGKWFKRKKFKMYITSLGLGLGLSIIFMFLLYPIAISSGWLVIMGAILGPTGFFYGVYDFMYIGLYQNKGNLLKAYYIGKKKFFWDVFSWAKPILTGWCFYTTFNLLLTLTLSNIFLATILLITLLGSMAGLLIFSVYILKVDQMIEVDDIRKKSLDNIKNKKDGSSN